MFKVVSKNILKGKLTLTTSLNSLQKNFIFLLEVTVLCWVMLLQYSQKFEFFKLVFKLVSKFNPLKTNFPII